MRDAAFVVAILSGKGGVGKTTISLNLARELSRRGPVWLLDLDLFNRGATSALWESEKQIPLSIAELILDAQKTSEETRSDPEKLALLFAEKLEKARPSISYDDRLAFIPAARATEGKVASYVLWHGMSERGVNAEIFLEAVITALMKLTPCGVVILDGHGGLDELTLGAALVSDTSYLVNEPDLVTFTGSVTLYREIAEQARRSKNDAWIEFIINRVSPRQSVKTLEMQFGPMLDTMSPAPEAVAVYFPLEPELFGVFGEDPFVSEIYTRFWFSRKIRLLAQKVAETGIASGILHKEWAPEHLPKEPAKVRTALRREWHKRGDVLLVSWLIALIFMLALWVRGLWVENPTESMGTPAFLTTTYCSFLVLAFVMVVSLGVMTLRWLRVQLVHLRNVRKLRGASSRRLRFGETESARRREAVESTVKKRTASAPLVGGCIAFVVLSVLAAIIVPNILTAMGRSRQKRSMADMRSIAAAAEARATDWNHYPEGDTSHLASAIQKDLAPTYIRNMPALDGWEGPFRYYWWKKEATDEFGLAESYAIVCAGKDGVFEHDDARKYTPQSTGAFDCDIVFIDGFFIVYPEGIQAQ